MAKIEVSLSQLVRNPDQLRETSRPLGSDDGKVESTAGEGRDGGSKKVALTTLGCKVNTFESELISETLQADDWQVVANSRRADLYLINTCTVTREADRQARQQVRRAVKRNPDALVIVTGCYAQMDPQACADIPGVDLVLGNDRKLDTHNLLPQLQRGELPKVLVGDLDQHISLPDKLLAGYEAHTRAFVQIQQGCDQGCTFCIIHKARGPSRSLPPSLVKRQVQRLVMNGYAEIVICGVDLGAYGEDLQGRGQSFDLVDLLEELLQMEYQEGNPFRIRLSSIDPHHISDRLVSLMASQSRICPHIHLSLQSGSTMVLKRMKRRYTAEKVRERIASLRAHLPQLVMSADVMVGFPTESDAQYQETEQILQELDIPFPHVFSYSERDGTPAARIPVDKQVPVSVRKQRNQRLRESVLPLKNRLMHSRIGQTAWVLPENTAAQPGYAQCRAEDYLPVLLEGGTPVVGRWLKVRYERIENDQLIAQDVSN